MVYSVDVSLLCYDYPRISVFYILYVMLKEPMYFQGLQPIHVVEAHRLLELQQLHSLMSKQHSITSFQQCNSRRKFERTEQPFKHMNERPPREQKPLTSFRICDILADRARETEQNRTELRQSDDLSGTNLSNNWSPCTCRPVSNSSSDSSDSCGSTPVSSANRHKCQAKKTYKTDRSFVRPWSASATSKLKTSCDRTGTFPFCHDDTNKGVDVLKKGAESHRHLSDDDVEIDVESCDTDDNDVTLTRLAGAERSPLDALVAMSSRAFLGLENYESQRNSENGHNSKNQISKKKRKTRTAFTNQQIYELEKRFIMQKYLTPVDRDDIAAKLGLTCAQVITWFQNRRAKFKRDIEEMKSDIVATSPASGDSTRDGNE